MKCPTWVVSFSDGEKGQEGLVCCADHLSDLLPEDRTCVVSHITSEHEFDYKKGLQVRNISVVKQPMED